MASDWSELPLDLLISIAKRLFSFEGFAGFGAVCSWWRSAAREVKFDSSRPQLPWLTLVNQTDGLDSKAEIYSLAKRRAFLLRSMPRQAYRSSSNLSSRGWIFSSDRRNPRSHFLLHPLNGTVFQLPDLECSVKRFVYTEDCTVIIIGTKASSRNSFCWFWRPEKPGWTKIMVSPDPFDVAYINGQLFSLMVTTDEALGQTVAYHKEGLDMLILGLNIPPDSGEKWFLAESGGEIFLVAAEFRGGYDSFEVLGFRVFSDRGERGRSKRLSSLGDRALFLGDGSSSVFVKASDFAGFCEPDCIYFAISDGVLGTYVDAGVYRMNDGKIEHWLRGQSPQPIWVQPTF